MDMSMKWKTMEKMQCNQVIYEVLSIEDPKKYPVPMNTSVPSITPDGGSCIVIEPDDELSIKYNITIEPYTIKDCDCSDPKNYDFYDKGRF